METRRTTYYTSTRTHAPIFLTLCRKYLFRSYVHTTQKRRSTWHAVTKRTDSREWSASSQETLMRTSERLARPTRTRWTWYRPMNHPHSALVGKRDTTKTLQQVKWTCLNQTTAAEHVRMRCARTSCKWTTELPNKQRVNLTALQRR